MEDRVVLITGGSSGIGLATAELFHSRGARVWITARNEERLAQAARSISSNVQFFPSDVTDEASLRGLATRIRDSEGHLDVLINSAGQLDLGRAEESVDVAERLIQANYLGVARTVAALLPLVRDADRGSIVTLSSFVGRLVPPYWSAYAASKYALQAYCHSLRQELHPEGIHVGLVLPGPVRSPMTEDRLGTPMYPVPWGVPVIAPDRVAQAILDAVFRRTPEVSVPRRFLPLLRFASAFPRVVDLFYRRYLR